MGIIGVNLNNINLDKNNSFDEDNPDNIILIKLLPWYSKFTKRKPLKHCIEIAYFLLQMHLWLILILFAFWY